MSVIAVGNSAGTDSGATPGNLTLSMPTGAGAQSIVILIISCANDTSPTTTVTDTGDYTAPSGWTLIGSIKQHVHDAIATTKWNPVGLQVWWSLGSNTNLTFTANNGTGDYSATKPKYVGSLMVNFTGVDLTAAKDVAGTGDAGSGSNTLTVSSVTVATGTAWEVMAATDWNTAGGTFAASGFTDVSNAAANSPAEILYNSTAKAQGATGTVSLTGSGGTTSQQQILAVPFALKPIDIPETYGRQNHAVMHQLLST